MKKLWKTMKNHEKNKNNDSESEKYKFIALQI